MSKVLFSFNIWMFREWRFGFRDQFRLTKKEARGLQQMCLFVVQVYAKTWIEASFSAQAARLDLELIKALGTYNRINPEIRDVALLKLSSHLWYVSEELVGLSFFDSDTSCETKNAMVTALRLEEIDGDDSAPKRVTLLKKSVRDLHLEDFVSGRTLHFFRKLHLDEAFLDLPPDSWQMDDGFQRSSQIVRNLAVVNDHVKEELRSSRSSTDPSQRMRSSFSSSFKWWRTTGRPSRTHGSAPWPKPGHSEEPGKHNTPAFERLIPQLRGDLEPGPG